MTDVTAGGGRGGVGIRLFVTGHEIVRRTFDQVGDSGKKMWSEIAMGERAANPAIRALSLGAESAKGAVEGLAARAGPATSALSAFGFAGLAAGAAIGALTLAIPILFRAMGESAALTDTAERIGMGVEALQSWRYIADEAGVETGTLESAMERLNSVMGRFKSGIGDGKLKPVFEELGITKAQLENVRSADELMLILADTLGQMRDRAKQVAFAKALGVEEALPILRLGSERVAELTQASRDLGLVIDQETVAALDEADRAIELASQRIDTSLRLSVAGLADDFADLVTWVAEAVVWLNKLNQTKVDTSWMDLPGRPLLHVIQDQMAGRTKEQGEAFRNPLGANIHSQLGDLADAAGAYDWPSVSAGFEPLGHTSGGNGAAAAAAEARRLEREAEQRRQRAQRASQQLTRVDDEIARSYGRGAMTIDDRAHYEVADLERERAARLREIKQAEDDYARTNGLSGLSQAEAELLRAKQDELTEQKKSVVEWDRRRDIAARRLQDEQDAAQAAVEFLDLDAQMAATQKERVRIEREILKATIDIARRRYQARLDDDAELSPEDRDRLMGGFNRNADRQVELFDHRENERLKAQFKSYGQEVVSVIEQGRIGEYIGQEIKARLLDGALESLLALFKSGGSSPEASGGGWVSTAFRAVSSWFGGGRALGGDTRAGRFYSTVEHGRPELFMLGGNGHVTGAAETARMLRDSLAETGPSGGYGGEAPLNVTMPAITINAPGADAAALARVEAELRRLRSEIPQMAVQSVADARQRRIIS